MTKSRLDKQGAIPALFATIHFRSEARPDGYTEQEVSWLNVVANEHLPELYQEMLEAHRQRFPDPSKDSRSEP